MKIYLIRHKKTGLFWRKRRDRNVPAGREKATTEEFTATFGFARTFVYGRRALGYVPEHLRDDVEAVGYELVEVERIMYKHGRKGITTIRQSNDGKVK